MENKILLETHHPHLITVDRVRIDEEALRIVQELQTETGLPARKIVSEMIKQGSQFIEVKEI